MNRPAPQCRTCGHRHYNFSPCPDQAEHAVPFVPSELSTRVPAGFHVTKEFGDTKDPNRWGSDSPPGTGWGATAIPIYRPGPRLRTGRLTLPEMES